MYVQEQNFGWPSTIWQCRTSSNKGSLRGPVRHAGAPDQSSGTTLNKNTGSIGAAQAHLHAHAHQRNAGQSSGSVKRKLETLRHFFNRRTTGARTCAHLCAVYPVNLSFNQTFLLILIRSRRDPDQASEEVLASVWFYANKHFMIICTAFSFPQNLAILVCNLISHHLEQSWLFQ